jgi:hypothetical protein
MSYPNSKQYPQDSDSESDSLPAPTPTIFPPPTYQQATAQHQRNQQPSVYTDPTDERHIPEVSSLQDPKPWLLGQQQHPYHRDAPPRTSSMQQYGTPGQTSSTSTEDSRQHNRNNQYRPPSFSPPQAPQSYGGVPYPGPPPKSHTMFSPHDSPPGRSQVAPVQSKSFHPPYLQLEGKGRPGNPQSQTSPQRTANRLYPDFERAALPSQPHIHAQTRGRDAAGWPPAPRCCYPSCNAPVATTTTNELTEFCGEKHMLCVLALHAVTHVWC